MDGYCRLGLLYFGLFRECFDPVYLSPLDSDFLAGFDPEIGSAVDCLYLVILIELSSGLAEKDFVIVHHVPVPQNLSSPVAVHCFLFLRPDHTFSNELTLASGLESIWYASDISEKIQ